MLQLKKGIQRELPCIMTDNVDFKTGITGLAFTDVTVKYAKEGDSPFSTKNMTVDDWIELGEGAYNIIFSLTELNTGGKFIYIVTSSGCIPYPGEVQLTDKELDDHAAEATLNTHETAQGGHRQYMTSKAGQELAIQFKQYGQLNDVNIFRGDKATIYFALSEDGTALDLTDATVWLAAKKTLADPECFFDVECDITDAEAGLCQAELTDTETGEVCKLIAEVEIAWPSGPPSTYGQFFIYIKEDIRKPAP